MLNWLMKKSTFQYSDITRELYRTRKLKGMMINREGELPIFVPLFLIETTPKGNEILIDILNTYNPWTQCLVAQEGINAFVLLSREECDYTVTIRTFLSINLEQVSEKILIYSANHIDTIS